MNFQNVEFLISAAAHKDFPKNRLPEMSGRRGRVRLFHGNGCSIRDAYPFGKGIT